MIIALEGGSGEHFGQFIALFRRYPNVLYMDVCTEVHGYCTLNIELFSIGF